ncbi:MAG: hypothetical protein AAGC70_05840 [Pseudomonadota bacterium]
MFDSEIQRDALPEIDTHDVGWPLVPVAIGLVLAWLVLALPWLDGTFTIPWDGKAHFAPQVHFMAATIGRGEWPWWTPHVFAGHPQIADPQSMIFSPPMAALALITPTPSLWAIDMAVLVTVLFGGLGVVVFARLRRWHWVAALVAALVFMFGGSMAWRLQHFGQVMSMAYLPWAILCIDIALRHGRTWAGAAAGIFAAAIFLGRDQVGLLSIYLLFAYALSLLFSRHRAKFVSILLPAAAGLVIGIAIVAIPLMLTLAFAAQSNRPAIDLAGAGAGSLHPALLMTAVVPNLYGAAGDMIDYWGPPSLIWEDTGLFIAQNMGVVYIGAIPLMVLVIAAVRGWLWDRKIVFFTASAAVALVYALGWYTPIFQAVYEVVPGVDKFRRPADATFLIGGIAAFLVGWGLDRGLNATDRLESIRPLRWSVIVAGTGVALTVLIALFWGRFVGAAPNIVLSAATFVVAIAVCAIAYWIRLIRPTAAGLLVVTAVTLDLGLHNGPNGANALSTNTIDMLQPAAPNPTLAKLSSLVEASTTDQYRPRIEFVGLGYHWPNASLTHGLDNTLGANPLRLAWYAGATGAGDTVASFDQRTFSALMPSYTAPLAQLLGLKYIVTGRPLPTDSGPGRGLRLVATIGPRHIYETPASIPRVVFATQAVVRDAVSGPQRTVPDLDYTSTVLLEPGAQATRTGATGTARIVTYENTDITISAESDQGGWVVLHDVWHPWWRVTIDNQPAELLRANVLFRAVEVPAGRHVVRFGFAPLAGAWRDLFAPPLSKPQTAPRARPEGL